MPIAVEMAGQDGAAVPSVAQVNVVLEIELATLLMDIVQLCRSSDGYNKLGSQRNLCAWHLERIVTGTGSGIHVVRLVNGYAARRGRDTLQPAPWIGFYRDRHLLALTRIFIADSKRSSVTVICVNLHHVYIHRNGDILVVHLDKVIADLTGNGIERVENEAIALAVSKILHAVYGMSLVSLSLGPDGIAFHRLDSRALLVSSGVNQHHSGMSFCLERYRRLRALRRVVNGHVGFAHFEDKHVFVFDDIPVRG